MNLYGNKNMEIILLYRSSIAEKRHESDLGDVYGNTHVIFTLLQQ